MALDLTIDKTADAARVRLSGEIVDDVDLTPILEGQRGELVLDLEGVTRLNSAGVRQWVRFVHAIPADVSVFLERCPAFFMRQVVMIGNFLGQARMRTLYLPYTCVDCDASCDKLVSAEELGTDAPPGPPACAACDGEVEFDETDDAYRAFLGEIRR